MKKPKQAVVTKRVQAGPNTTVPIRKDAHRKARIACATINASMVDFVSAAVAKEAAQHVSA